MTSLKDLIAGFPLQLKRGNLHQEILGITSHSGEAQPGFLFLARRGASYNGAEFIAEAVQRGVVAVVSEDDEEIDIDGVAHLVTPSVRAIEPLIATRFYSFPSDALKVVGVTGTNGKTTTTWMIYGLLTALGIKTGLNGTVESRIGQEVISQSIRTTPDSITNQAFLRRIVNENGRAVAMEVASHGLDQGRVVGIEFDVAVFTNLTPEHLDYHKTMDSYADAKKKLFDGLQSRNRKKGLPLAVVNGDDTWHHYLLREYTGPCLLYGSSEECDLRIKETSFKSDHTNFVIEYEGKNYPCTIPYVGNFNVYNACAAMGALLGLGYHWEELHPFLPNMIRVPGRLEYVPNALNRIVYIDYAHTHDGLEQVLHALKKSCPHLSIWLVFGCGGDRKRERRLMGEIASQLADYSILTSDNPRTENPLDIIQEIEIGFKEKKNYYICMDRRHAIRFALEKMPSDSCLLIAGKGHEEYQCIGSQKLPFSDRKVVTELCMELTECR